MSVRRVLAAGGAALTCAVLLASCSLIPHMPSPAYDDTGQKDDVVMAHIADAVEHHDTTALKKLFSPRARTHATDLDSGLTYFLSVFPAGRLRWKTLGAAGKGVSTGFLRYSWADFASYRVSVAGKKFDVYFPYVQSDSDHPDDVGIRALGAWPTPPTPYMANGAKWPSDRWATQFGLTDRNVVTGAPSVYVPGAPRSILEHVGMTPATEMQRIAEAAQNHDATALTNLFSSRARQKAPDLDAGVQYFLSAFPSGPVTWKKAGVAGGQEGGGWKDEIVEDCPTYTITANGTEYAVYFTDFVVNQADTDNIGIYALGIAPYVAESGTTPGPPAQFTAWAKSQLPDDATGRSRGGPGVYIPAT